MRRSWNRIERPNQQRNRNEDREAFIITPFPPAMIISRQAGADNKERESMSEKEKMKSEEIAKVLAENPTAKIYLAGLAQGMKLAKSMEPEAEQPTPAGKEAANE